jgi:hypothetical protein
MSKTLCGISISFTVRTPEHLPLREGEQMYSDDVTAEFRDFIQGAADTWYTRRGCDLLTHEPIVS